MTEPIKEEIKRKLAIKTVQLDALGEEEAQIRARLDKLVGERNAPKTQTEELPEEVQKLIDEEMVRLKERQDHWKRRGDTLLGEIVTESIELLKSDRIGYFTIERDDHQEALEQTYGNYFRGTEAERVESRICEIEKIKKYQKIIDALESGKKAELPSISETPIPSSVEPQKETPTLKRESDVTTFASSQTETGFSPEIALEETRADIERRRKEELENPDITVEDYIVANPELTESEKRSARDNGIIPYYEEVKNQAKLAFEYLNGEMGVNTFLFMSRYLSIDTERESEEELRMHADERASRWRPVLDKINAKYNAELWGRMESKVVPLTSEISTEVPKESTTETVAPTEKLNTTIPALEIVTPALEAPVIKSDAEARGNEKAEREAMLRRIIADATRELAELEKKLGSIRKAKRVAKETAEKIPEIYEIPVALLEEEIKSLLSSLKAVNEVKKVVVEKIEGNSDKMKLIIACNAKFEGEKLGVKVNMGNHDAKIEAICENRGDVIVINDYEVNVGDDNYNNLKRTGLETILKLTIREHIGKIPEKLKTYIEEKKGKRVTRIWIENNQLQTELL